MPKMVLVLTIYGVATMLPLFLALSGGFSETIFNLPLQWEGLADLILTPWIGVGTFALLYVLIPAASSQEIHNPNRFRILYFAFSVIYLEGHGIHLAGNAIRQAVFVKIPAGLSDSITFYDEIFGHALWYLGALGLAGVTLYYQAMLPSIEKPNRFQRSLLVISGIFYGIGFAIFILEGRAAAWIFPLVLVVLIIGMIQGLRSRGEMQLRPAWWFFLPGFASLLIFIFLWYLRFGGLVEPIMVVGG